MEIIIDKHEYPYWHTALGCYIHSKTHLKMEMKARGCIEVGTEDTRSKKNKGREHRDIFYEHHPKGQWVGHPMSGYGIPAHKLNKGVIL